MVYGSFYKQYQTKHLITLQTHWEIQSEKHIKTKIIYTKLLKSYIKTQPVINQLHTTLYKNSFINHSNILIPTKINKGQVRTLYPNLPRFINPTTYQNIYQRPLLYFFLYGPHILSRKIIFTASSGDLSNTTKFNTAFFINTA